MLPKFEPYIEKGEIANLPAYNFYCRISGIETEEPMSGETVLLEQKYDPKAVHKTYDTDQKIEDELEGQKNAEESKEIAKKKGKKER